MITAIEVMRIHYSN